jgi:hypothetical protein
MAAIGTERIPVRRRAAHSATAILSVFDQNARSVEHGRENGPSLHVQHEPFHRTHR